MVQVMHTVIKGTKTIAEYKQVQEDMQEKARNYHLTAI